MIDYREVSIVIPFYNRWVLTNQAIANLHQHGLSGCEIVLYDDGSTEWEQVARGIRVFEPFFPKLKYVRGEENKGFGYAHNQGVAHSSGKYLFLLSNDVQVFGNFVKPVVEYLRDYPFRLVGPRVLREDTGWNTFHINGQKTTFQYLEGWLVCLTRAAWDRIGGFDERYLPFDYEDIDLSTTAMQLGMELVEMKLPVKHHLGGTIGVYHKGPQRLVQTEKNKIKFEKKWMELLTE